MQKLKSVLTLLLYVFISLIVACIVSILLAIVDNFFEDLNLAYVWLIIKVALYTIIILVGIGKYKKTRKK